MIPYECAICNLKELDEPHNHRLGYIIYIETQWDSGVLSDKWLTSRIPRDRKWTLEHDAPKFFDNIEEGKKAVTAFISQKHNPPLDDGLGTVIYAILDDYGSDAHATMEADLWRAEHFVMKQEVFVLWRSR